MECERHSCRAEAISWRCSTPLTRIFSPFRRPSAKWARWSWICQATTNTGAPPRRRATRARRCSPARAAAGAARFGQRVSGCRGTHRGPPVSRVLVADVYTPNSQMKLVRIDHRMEWDDAFRDFCKGLEAGVLPDGASSDPKPVVMCGDFNVAHEEIDLKNLVLTEVAPGFSDEERRKLTELVDSGFMDSFRQLYPDRGALQLVELPVPGPGDECRMAHRLLPGERCAARSCGGRQHLLRRRGLYLLPRSASAGHRTTTVVAVGKLKEKFWVAACDEDLKRLRPYAKVAVTEIPEMPSGSAPAAWRRPASARVGFRRRCLDARTSSSWPSRESSVERPFSRHLDDSGPRGASELAFVRIGGSDGRERCGAGTRRRDVLFRPHHPAHSLGPRRAARAARPRLQNLRGEPDQSSDLLFDV